MLAHRKYPRGLGDVYYDIRKLHRLGEICFLDCGGWIFPKLKKLVVESDLLAKHFYKDSKIMDYTVRTLAHPNVFCYKPVLLKYVTTEVFSRFLKEWTTDHLVIYFDHRMIQHNYLKCDLLDLLDTEGLQIKCNTIDKSTVRWQVIRIQ
jgi:hypothetical protein